MSRCLEFYKRWERDPNWCEKCPDAVRKINRYIDLIDCINIDGDRKENTNVFLSEGAARPLLEIRDEDIKEKAISSVKNALETGTNPLNGQFTKKLTETDIKKIIENLEREPRRAELISKAETVAALSETIKLFAGNFLTEYHKIEFESVDCIITDPPYVKEWLHNYESFAEAATYVLKPGGFLISYVGHIHLDVILKQMTPHLEYYWIAMLKHSGTNAAVHSRSVQCGMKPILIFNKSPRMKPKRYFNDVILGTGKEKDAHEWQQGEEELRQIFEPFTDPGDTVLDPFMGSGTVISMAKKMNRLAIGFDLDAENVEVVKGRLVDGTF